jgi:hypothetical protein
MLGGDDPGQQPGRGGVEESAGGARHPGEHRDRPHVGRASDQQRGEQALACEPHRVGGHHHRAARDAVGHDAAEQQTGD